MRSLYIAGRMHCGSTFISVLLGAGHDAFAAGELINGLKRGRREPCACQRALEECEVWSAVAAEYGRRTGRDLFDDARWLYEQGGIRQFRRARAARGSGLPWSTYLARQRDILAAIGAVTGAAVGVDSGKEFTRALLILFSDPDAKVIHLVRKPVSIVGSYYWRQARGSQFHFNKRSYDVGMLRFPALMLVAASWNVGVVAGYLLERAAPGRVLHVSYEAFCADPETELRRIGEFAGLDLGPAIEKVAAGAALPLGHSLAGNDEIKTDDGTFTFVPNVSGRRKLPWIYRAGASVLSAPGRVFRSLALRSG